MFLLTPKCQSALSQTLTGVVVWGLFFCFSQVLSLICLHPQWLPVDLNKLQFITCWDIKGQRSRPLLTTGGEDVAWINCYWWFLRFCIWGGCLAVTRWRTRCTLLTQENTTGLMMFECKYVKVIIVSVSWIMNNDKKGFSVINKALTPPARVRPLLFSAQTNQLQENEVELSHCFHLRKACKYRTER